MQQTANVTSIQLPEGGDISNTLQKLSLYSYLSYILNIFPPTKTYKFWLLHKHKFWHCLSQIQENMRFFIAAFFLSVLFSSTGKHDLCLFLSFLQLTMLNLLNSVVFSSPAAYDPLDPNGNITIKWDIMSWTPDGYVVSYSQSKQNLVSMTFHL